MERAETDLRYVANPVRLADTAGTGLAILILARAALGILFSSSSKFARFVDSCGTRRFALDLGLDFSTIVVVLAPHENSDREDCRFP
jgi:hypothetical protein